MNFIDNLNLEIYENGSLVTSIGGPILDGLAFFEALQNIFSFSDGGTDDSYYVITYEFEGQGPVTRDSRDIKPNTTLSEVQVMTFNLLYSIGRSFYPDVIGQIRAMNEPDRKGLQLNLWRNNENRDVHRIIHKGK